MARKSSTLGELLALLFTPVVWLLRPFIGRKRASPGLVKWFYKSPEWKRLRYDHLAQNPACALCGRSARDGARMNVDHIKPLSYHWNLRLTPHNLQPSAPTAITARTPKPPIIAPNVTTDAKRFNVKESSPALRPKS